MDSSVGMKKVDEKAIMIASSAVGMQLKYWRKREREREREKGEWENVKNVNEMGKNGYVRHRGQ